MALRVLLVENELGDSVPGHDLDELFDREGLWEHRCRPEPVGLFGRLLVSGAHDDSGRGVALLDTPYRRTRAARLVPVETDEVGDDHIGSRIRCHALEPVDKQQLVSLIAQHLAKEVSSSAVVLDDQDVSYAPHARGFAARAQF